MLIYNQEDHCCETTLPISIYDSFIQNNFMAFLTALSKLVLVVINLICYY
jgi:hypothetical protein